MINLIKDKRYRITETNGKKFTSIFEEELVMLGKDCLKFSWTHIVLDKTLIAKIEEADMIKIWDRVTKASCDEEYKKYGTINGKEPRQTYKYTEIYNRESK